MLEFTYISVRFLKWEEEKMAEILGVIVRIIMSINLVIWRGQRWLERNEIEQARYERTRKKEIERIKNEVKSILLFFTGYY